jgi:hypothetical protein
MESDKEKWINGVLGSLASIQRAKPKQDLFSKIQKEIAKPEGKVISMRQLRITAAAAVLLLTINVFLLTQYAKSSQKNTTEWVTEVDANEQLISNYNLYE